MNSLSTLVSTLCLMTACVAVQAAPPARYRVTDLGTLGGVYSYGNGLNNAGQVTGISSLPGNINNTDIFVYSNGEMIDLDPYPTRLEGWGMAINNNGRVAGTVQNSNDQTLHAFISGGYKGRTLQALGTLGGPQSAGYGINDADDVVGAADLADGSRHAALFKGGSVIDLGTLGGRNSMAYSINRFGQIVGISDSATIGQSSRAFFYDNGVLADLGAFPGGAQSGAFGINDAGKVTGYAEAADFQVHAFLYSAGTMVQIDGGLNATSSKGLAVANSGDVVGAAFSPRGNYGFIYSGGVAVNLNTLLDPDTGAGWTIVAGVAINDSGVILAEGCKARICGYPTQPFGHALLLTPIEP